MGRRYKDKKNQREDASSLALRTKDALSKKQKGKKKRFTTQVGFQCTKFKSKLEKGTEGSGCFKNLMLRRNTSPSSNKKNRSSFLN